MNRHKLTPEERIKRQRFRIGVTNACACPRCGSAHGIRCLRNNGAPRKSPHLERVLLARSAKKE